MVLGGFHCALFVIRIDVKKNKKKHVRKQYFRLQLRVDATRQSVTEDDHVNERRGGNANAAIFGNGGRLLKQKRHNSVQDRANDDGMQRHDQASFCHYLIIGF